MFHHNTQKLCDRGAEDTGKLYVYYNQREAGKRRERVIATVHRHSVQCAVTHKNTCITNFPLPRLPLCYACPASNLYENGLRILRVEKEKVLAYFPQEQSDGKNKVLVFEQGVREMLQQAMAWDYDDDALLLAKMANRRLSPVTGLVICLTCLEIVIKSMINWIIEVSLFLFCNRSRLLKVSSGLRLFLYSTTPKSSPSVFQFEGATKVPAEFELAYMKLREQVEKVLRHSAYSMVDLGQLFNPLNKHDTTPTLVQQLQQASKMELHIVCFQLFCFSNLVQCPAAATGLQDGTTYSLLPVVLATKHNVSRYELRKYYYIIMRIFGIPLKLSSLNLNIYPKKRRFRWCSLESHITGAPDLLPIPTTVCGGCQASSLVRTVRGGTLGGLPRDTELKCPSVYNTLAEAPVVTWTGASVSLSGLNMCGYVYIPDEWIIERMVFLTVLFVHYVCRPLAALWEQIFEQAVPWRLSTPAFMNEPVYLVLSCTWVGEPCLDQARNLRRRERPSIPVALPRYRYLVYRELRIAALTFSLRHHPKSAAVNGAGCPGRKKEGLPARSLNGPTRARRRHDRHTWRNLPLALGQWNSNNPSAMNEHPGALSKLRQLSATAAGVTSLRPQHTVTTLVAWGVIQDASPATVTSQFRDGWKYK
uniref:Uncharacterized protein n=1 Tax=Timema bartmani TaxID=61472 RepID=A0A7R9EUH1_9NEOP|nr:unnamed protein product [Timema bartmani]